MFPDLSEGHPRLLPLSVVRPKETAEPWSIVYIAP